MSEDYETPTECFCCVANAPCSWCEDTNNLCETCDCDVNHCTCEEDESNEPVNLINIEEYEKLINREY
jgi:hypothetical protein